MSWDGYRRVPITCEERNVLVAGLGGLSVYSTYTR